MGKAYVQLARPFTLLPPLFGIISGAVCAWGSAHNPDPSRAVTASVILTVALGSLCASFLNAALNALNQIYDLEIDRINKPSRPLVTGAISMREAWIFTWIFYALAIVPTWLVVVYPYNTFAAKFFAPLSQHECFFIYIAGMICTFVYSAPIVGRTKAHPIGALTGVLTGNHTALIVLGIALALWGVYTVWLIVRNPDELTATENHPSWRHMYLMMMGAQIGFAVAYII